MKCVVCEIRGVRELILWRAAHNWAIKKCNKMEHLNPHTIDSCLRNILIDHGILQAIKFGSFDQCDFFSSYGPANSGILTRREISKIVPFLDRFYRPDRVTWENEPLVLDTSQRPGRSMSYILFREAIIGGMHV